MQNSSLASILPMLMLGNASDSSSPVSILISKYGRVKYSGADGERHKVVGGAVIDNGGKVKLSGNASALLFSNGKYKLLDEAGEYALSDLFPKGGMQKLNFDSRFNNYLMTAIDLVVGAGEDDAWGKLSGSKGGGDAWGKLSGSKGGGDAWGRLSGSKGGGDAWGKLSGSKGGGDAWGKLSGSKGGGDAWGKLSGSKGGGDAWGDEEGRVVPILPFGKVPAQPIIFQWSQPQINQSYILEILDEAGGIVFSSEVKDNWWQVNLKSLPLKAGETYAWRINVADHPEKVSAKVRISITEEQAEALLEDKLKKSDAYQLQDPVLTSLMEAVVLEEAAHFYEANQRYELLRQSFKKNNLVKLMQAAFYLRYQLKPRAEQLFWKMEKTRDL